MSTHFLEIWFQATPTNAHIQSPLLNVELAKVGINCPLITTRV
jgi:hypothetical protein